MTQWHMSAHGPKHDLSRCNCVAGEEAGQGDHGCAAHRLAREVDRDGCHLGQPQFEAGRMIWKTEHGRCG